MDVFFISPRGLNVIEYYNGWGLFYHKIKIILKKKVNEKDDK